MGELFSALVTVGIGVGVFLGGFCGLYAITNLIRGRWQERTRMWLFVGPAVLLLVIGLLYPAIRTIFNSFFADTARGTTGDFIGLDNYTEILSSDAGQNALINNLIWAVFGTALSTFIGLTVARLADRMKGEALARALVFLPTAVSFVGAGIIWRFIYAPPARGDADQIGLLNQIWTTIGGEPQRWLQDWPRNTLLLIVVMIWIQAGFATVVFSAAIKGVPDSLLEAARIDGANEGQVFWRIVIPAIRGTIVTVVTTTVIAVLKVFDIVQSMTNGNFDTDVIANAMYKAAFRESSPNRGAALAVILFIAVIPVVIINQRNQRLQRENA
jgi:alpha-glucoside transport system permease protein